MLDFVLAFAAPVIDLPPPLPRVPIVATVSPNDRATRRQDVVVMKAVSGRCSDGPLDISGLDAPMANLAWASSNNVDSPVTMRFRINENGRPLGIKRDPAGFGTMADLTPSLAASRFAANAVRDECSIIYQPRRTSIADADLPDLISYSIFAQTRPPKEVFDRITAAGSDCNMQRPVVLLRAFPDFAKIAPTSGRSDWSMVQFDIDASGKPVRLNIFATTGNKALDKASVNAVAQSRFAKGTKKGCLYPYWRRAGTLAAPESKSPEAYRNEDSICPQKLEWKYQPALVYPENFRRRYIEGWAVIAFDVAPWGAVGNAKILASEPAAEFGELARQIVSASSTAPSKQGYSNCVEKVRYVMSPQDRQTDPKID